MRPQLAHKARLRWDEQAREYVLLWPERGLRLNATAAAVVELCDGERTEADIAAVLAARFDAPLARVADDVAELLARLRDAGLVGDR